MDGWMDVNPLGAKCGIHGKLLDATGYQLGMLTASLNQYINGLPPFKAISFHHY